MTDARSDPLTPYLYAGGAEPAVSGDPLDAQVAAQAKAAAAASVMQPGNPDQAGQGNQLGRAFGLPADTAQRQAPALIATQQARQASALIDAHPGVGGWLSDPRNAAVAKDDLGNVRQVAGFVSRAGDTMRAPTAPAPTLWNSLKGIYNSTVSSFASAAASLNQVAADWIPDLRPTPAAGIPLAPTGATSDTYARQRAQAQVAIGAARPGFQGGVAGTAYDIASTVAQAAPSIGATILGGPGVGIGVASAQFGGDAYGKYRARGATRGQAAVGGALEGAIASAAEVLPLGYLTTKIGSTGLKPFIAGFLGRDLSAMEAQTVANKVVDTAIANPDKTWREAAGELPSEMGNAALTALTFGGLAGAAHIVGNRLSGGEQAGFQAADQAGAIDHIMTAAADSKVRARDPEAFSNLIAGLTKETPSEHLYVPAEAAASYFQSHDIDYRNDSFWGDYADQIDDGLHTGGDIVIPTSEAAAHLAGTPAWDALKNDTRASPGGASLSEAQAFEADKAGAMEKLGASMAVQFQADREAAAPRDAVYQDVRDKLTNAGFTQDAAHTNAELLAQRYATRAERLGQPLTGDETANISVNSVLPESLAPIAAKDGGDVALQGIVNVMRGESGAKKLGPTLLDWIGQQGGIEDKGGDLRAMGLASMRGVARKGERKLIRDHTADGQGDMIGGRAQQNANSPDELAARAQEAGYFPKGERPTVNDLHTAIDRELRGDPVHVGARDERVASDHAAAGELRRLLEDAGHDPDTATMAQIKGAVDKFREAQSGGLMQSYGDNPRGQITFLADGKSVIDLFQERNTSTFAHEMGHQWLEELRHDATSEGAPDQLRADWQAAQDWFKANGHGIGEDGVMPVDAHELWARGIERYLLEGKAPSSSLRRVFDTFRSWLLNVYQVVANVRSPITPEIREVMDRLVATDQEIADASERQSVSDLFDAAADAGMSGEEFAAYKRLASDARDEAHSALLFKTMATIRQQRTKAWADEQTKVRDEVTQEVDAQPQMRALHYLRTGKLLDEPDAPAEKVRLSREWLIDQYGEGVLAQLPRSVPPIYAETNAHAADDIAERVGFRSGDEMVRTLIAMADRRREMKAAGDERSVRAALIDHATEQTMRDRHGDPLTDGSIEEDALAAVQNDTQGEKMAFELRVLSRRSNTQPTPYSMAKQWAADRIAQGTVQESTSGASIQRYSRAAAKAGKAAEAAMISRDYDEAFKQKQAQMLNNALVSEAGRVRDQVDAARDRLAGYAKRRTMKSMDQGYLEQIHALLEQVDLRQQSQTAVDRRTSFEDWANEQQANGHDIVVPPSFAATLGATHWSRLTVEKMLGLDDTVKQIAHLGRLKQTLIDGKEARDFSAVVDEARASGDNISGPPPASLADPGAWENMKGGVASVDAMMLKMETIIDWMDGGNSEGVFNRIAFKPIAEAQHRESAMLHDYLGDIKGLFEAMPAKEVSGWQDKLTLPFIDRQTGEAAVMQRHKVVAMALNIGNEGNLQRLADGHRWDAGAVQDYLNRTLTKHEWGFVQGVWDTINKLWPEIEAMEKRINGVAPEKVEPRAFETPHGEMRGGYYPAIYNADRNLAAEERRGRDTDLLAGNYTKASTVASSTKERAARVVNQPLLLDLGVINRHLSEVIHDVTHREAVMQAWKFLTNEKVAGTVDKALGPAIRKQLRPWVQHVANSFAADRVGNEAFGKFITALRANVTAVGLGLRATTILVHSSGLVYGSEVVGGKWMAQGLAAMAKDPVGTIRHVTETSPEVRAHLEHYDRDIGAMITRLDTSRPGNKAVQHIRDAQRFMFHGIGWMVQKVSVPVWIGGYNKAISEGMSEPDARYAADKAVRQTMGSAGAKDLAAIQRSTGNWGQVAKLFTMFYTQMAAQYQRQRTLGRDVMGVDQRRARDLPKLAARAFFLVGMAPMWDALIKLAVTGRGPDDNESWSQWAFGHTLANQLAPIPGMRDIATPIMAKLTGQHAFTPSITPLENVYKSLVTSAGDAGALLHGAPVHNGLRHTLETVGYTTGLVPGQVAAASQFLKDVADGSQHPDGLRQWVNGMSTGHAEPVKH